MRNVDEMSEVELTEELLRRKKAREAAETPKLLENPDLTGLIRTCQGYIADVKKGRTDEDDPHYIYEEALKALYGKDVFNWINKH